MPKRKVFGVLVGLLALGAPATLALAGIGRGEHHDVRADFTTTRAHRSSGLKLLSNRKDYQPPPQGQQADPVTRVEITLQRGVEIDFRAVKTCDERTLEEDGPAGCPKGSEISDPDEPGSAEAITGLGPGVDPIRETVRVFASDDVSESSGDQEGFLLYLQPKGAVGTTAAIPARLTRGRRIRVDIPPLCLPGDNPATPQCDRGESVLTKLEVTIEEHHRGRGSRRRNFIETPHCDERPYRWEEQFRYTFRRTERETVTARQSCKKED